MTTSSLFPAIAFAGAPPAPRARADPRRLLLLFGGLVILVIIGAAGWFIIHLRVTAMANVEREMSNLSVVLAEQTARTLQSVELVLDAVEGQLAVHDFGRGADGKAVHDMLSEKIAGVPQIKFASVIGPDGTLRFSSYAYPAGQLNLADRPYFITHRDETDRRFTISVPLQSRGKGEWIIFVSRRLTAADGSFAGVLSAALDPAYFESVYKAATRADGMAISLLRNDGILLARYPREERYIGKSFADSSLFSRLSGSSEDGAVRVAPNFGNQPRLFAPLAVSGYPLVVTPSVDQEKVLADWRHEARLVGTAAAAAAIAIFVLLIFLYRLFGQIAATNAALRASEEATRQQADILSTLTENLPIGVSLVGSDMHYLAFNRLFLDQSGLPADAFRVGDSVGKLVRLLAERGEVNPDGYDVAVDERVSSRLTQRRAGQPAQFERRRADGRIIDVRIVPLPGGGFVSTRVDITEKKQIEQQLIQAQKMEAIGNLTGGLAHDFNNLLGIIIGNLDLARPLVKATDTAEELVGEALDAATRGAELTRRLLAFARRQPLRPENIDVNALVAKTLKLASRKLGSNIIVALEPARDVWPISADPAQLEAAIINLVNNARDAMPLGGKMTIATGNRHLDADDASAHLGVVPGDYAMIVVSDTGAGMPPEIVARIFEPFYTTKGHENGMGLGLSMVFGFMQQSGGHVTVHSAVGVGTTFRLYLPRDPMATAQMAKPAPLPVAKSAGETVLVVEDNTALRRVVTRQLRELGYRVAEADRADAAFSYLEHERADILFTDIVLPGATNGFALARSVSERWPATKILLTSGFPDAKLSDELDALGSVRLLGKPYRKEELAQTLREVLDG